MTTNDPNSGLLDRLAAYREQVTRLDTREIEHHAAVSGQLAELTDQATALGRVVQEHAAALTRLAVTSQTDPNTAGYHPDLTPAWWKLADADRQEPIARLRAWVEHVYRPLAEQLRIETNRCGHPRNPAPADGQPWSRP